MNSFTSVVLFGAALLPVYGYYPHQHGDLLSSDQEPSEEQSEGFDSPHRLFWNVS